MEFGKIDDPFKLDLIDWDLPPDDPLTEPFLNQFSLKNLNLMVGAPAWNHKEWVGKVYPEKAKPVDYLSFYSKYFNTIELNTTHYRIPTVEQTKRWTEKVAKDFLFCPKIFQGISHKSAGLLDPELLNSWFDFLKELGNHRGPSFLQLPPYFDYSYKAKLFKFLQLWPVEFQLAIEFRHSSWFQEGTILPALVEYLQTRNIGLVITDVAGRRDVLHSSVSASFSLIRFIGNALHSSDFTRARKWNERLENWNNKGLQNVFFFVHEPDDILVPDMTEHLKTLSMFHSFAHRVS